MQTVCNSSGPSPEDFHKSDSKLGEVWTDLNMREHKLVPKYAGHSQLPTVVCSANSLEPSLPVGFIRCADPKNQRLGTRPPAAPVRPARPTAPALPASAQLPPKIPADATLVFDVDLVSFDCQEPCFAWNTRGLVGRTGWRRLCSEPRKKKKENVNTVNIFPKFIPWRIGGTTHQQPGNSGVLLCLRGTPGTPVD